MALDKLTKVQSVGISSFIQVVGVVTATQGFDGNITGIITATGDLTFGANSRAKLFENGTQSGVQATNSSSSAHLMTHDGNEDIHVDPSGYIKVEVAGSERLRITSAGKVGINTASPRAVLDVEGNAENATLMLHSNDANANLQFSDNTGGARILNYGGDLAFRTGTNAHVFGTGDSEALRITSDGRLLLGTTNAGGNNTANHLVVANNDSASDQAGISIRGGTSGRSQIFFSDGTSGQDEYRGMLRYDHSENSMQFRTNATERLRIDSGGTVHVNSPDTASGGRIYAASSKLYLQSGNGRQSFNIADMAAGQSATHEFNSSGNLVLASGGNLVLASGSGIDFTATSDTSASNASASSELLDDYEEGTWTPRIINSNGSSANISAQPSNRVGTYVKIGNRLFFNCWITGSLTTTETTTSVRIAGLPYNASSNGNAYSALTIWNYTAFSGYKDEIIVRNNTGDDQIIIQRYGADLNFNDIIKSGLNFMISGQYKV